MLMVKGVIRKVEPIPMPLRREIPPFDRETLEQQLFGINKGFLTAVLGCNKLVAHGKGRLADNLFRMRASKPESYLI